ncbi:hypothetical protein M8818_002863 [Zalaria obscura]|uniref:Uncharacterized protein n=1 Tax=Zalaria obscura TaxID=2024903 RepID=A0ACC3SHP5_9PEZI
MVSIRRTPPVGPQNWAPSAPPVRCSSSSVHRKLLTLHNVPSTTFLLNLYFIHNVIRGVARHAQKRNTILVSYPFESCLTNNGHSHTIAARLLSLGYKPLFRPTDGADRSKRVAANAFGIPPATLSYRIAGQHSRSHAREPEQVLSNAEKTTLSTASQDLYRLDPPYREFKAQRYKYSSVGDMVQYDDRASDCAPVPAGLHLQHG